MTEQEAVRHLIACQQLVRHSDASGTGRYYRPTVEERPLIAWWFW